MFFRMLSDVQRWLMLLFVVLVGFSAAFFMVFRGRSGFGLGSG